MKQRRVTLQWQASGCWIVRAIGVRGCHTYGTSIPQALTRIREALSLWVDDPPTTTIVPTYVLPHTLGTTLDAAVRARRRSEAARSAAAEATVASIRNLTAAGFSRRDAATVLGLSHQRVQQLLGDADG